MPITINRALLVGNLTRDPEVRYIPSGTAVCEFSVAVNSREKKGEEWVDRVDFFDIVTWGSTAEACGQYLVRGSQVGVDGVLRHERWEKDGQKHSRVKIRAEVVQFLTRNSGGGSAADGGAPGPQAVPAAQTSSDDDIPF